jgi:hypothetical protein
VATANPNQEQKYSIFPKEPNNRLKIPEKLLLFASYGMLNPLQTSDFAVFTMYNIMYKKT